MTNKQHLKNKKTFGNTLNTNIAGPYFHLDKKKPAEQVGCLI